MTRLGPKAAWLLAAAMFWAACGREAPPVEVALPVDSEEAWELLEGQAVVLGQELTVTGNQRLASEGRLILSGCGRLFQPTQVAQPGEPARDRRRRNRLCRVVLDDGSQEENPRPVPFMRLSTLRSGDKMDGLKARVARQGEELVLTPLGEAIVKTANDRPMIPARVQGMVRVVSFNVLNFFNGDGRGGGYPAPRGADSEREKRRQLDKLAAALAGMNPDLVALQELENDYGEDFPAAAELAAALSERSGFPYAFVDPGRPLGSDAVAVGFLYRAESMRPVGDPAWCEMPPFDRRRPPLAQTFQEVASEQVFTAVSVHFKSKRCGGNAQGPNAAQGDGQGCWNRERLQAARTLAEWAGEDPTGQGDPDLLLLGDFNAHALEDPIRELASAGYVDLIERFQPPEQRYSFVFQGASGQLDYALASPGMALQARGALIWHINSDEPRVFDYNLENKPPNAYSPGPYRSSDHDPVLVGLTLAGQ